MTALLEVMARLRNPVDGCPWDLEQDFETIIPYTIEEAYEVAQAITTQDMPGLVDELGDLLFQIVFYAQLGRERRLFNFADVAQSITNKMIRRHPHVFGDADAADVEGKWESIKAQERRIRGEPERRSALDGVAMERAPLKRAFAMQKRAARLGFDWPHVDAVVDKLDEEAQELRASVTASDDVGAEAELGDVLFTAVNIARHLGVDPEVALMKANTRFEQRFRAMEAASTQSGGLGALDG
ncbi:MAG: nucleoside triphosphate pyrophosphohydrolase, partial [Chromatiales bacterium]|nr:nucleoside triphosphate pyrophosphohydrolase [Chromatiales bacterium]